MAVIGGVMPVVMPVVAIAAVVMVAVVVMIRVSVMIRSRVMVRMMPAVPMSVPAMAMAVVSEGQCRRERKHGGENDLLHV